MSKKILFIAPLPPPITGQSVASEKIINNLKYEYIFNTINFSKKNFKHGISSFGRILEVIDIIKKVIKNRKTADIVYLTLSQSLAGNIKDLIILFLTRSKKQIIHLHGGGISNIIYDRHPVIFYLNKIILKHVDKIIVLGKSLKSIYSFLDEKRICVVPNYSDKYLFLNEKDIREKYKTDSINILFLSNLIPGKGYKELADAAVNLSEKYKNKISFSFIGGFESGDDNDFLEKINSIENIKYHGVVKGYDRLEYFKKAHVFCLPTYYPYEGQPISILESYAAGCNVVTTDHAGIGDVFYDNINGRYVEKKSVESLQSVLDNLITEYFNDKSRMLKTGLNNREIAEKKFTEKNYLNNIKQIFDDM